MYVANSSEILFFPVQMRNSKHDIDDIWLLEITFGVEKFRYTERKTSFNARKELVFLLNSRKKFQILAFVGEKTSKNLRQRTIFQWTSFFVIPSLQHFYQIYVVKSIWVNNRTALLWTQFMCLACLYILCHRSIYSNR